MKSCGVDADEFTLDDGCGLSKQNQISSNALAQVLIHNFTGPNRETFVAEVVTPAMAEPEGAARLRALAESWLAYVEHRVFPGGCFMVATLSEFDSRPGPVRDALRQARRSWLRLLERNARLAQEAGEIPADARPALVAFEVDALLSMANVQRNITDDVSALDDARQLIELRLGG